MTATTLRPLRITRFANSVPGLCVVAVSLAAGLDESVPLGWLLTVMLLPAGIVLAIRGYRMGVRCEATCAVVFGLLRTRVIPRGGVIEITPFPAMRWRAASGRLRWTPLTAFIDSPSASRLFADHNKRCIDRLRQWAGT